LANKVCELESLKSDAKGKAKEFKDQMKELAEEIQELATAIRSGQEERDAQMELGGIRRVRAID
jgi:NTP pyrophosphatase (non-canonical NTP hydrolase)